MKQMPFFSISPSLPSAQPGRNDTSTRKKAHYRGSRNTAGCTQAEEDLLQ